MKRKKLSIGLGLLATLVIIAVVLPYFIPTDALKKPVLDKLQQSTGYKVNVEGAMRIKLFPTVGFHIENATVEGSDFAATKVPLLALKSMTVDVALFPLLGGDIVVKELVMEDPQINAKVNAAGKANWEPAIPANPKAEKAATTDKGKSTLSALDTLQLQDVRLTNGNLVYSDQKAGKQWEARQLNLTLSLPDIDEPFEIKGNVLYDGKQAKFSGRIDTLQALLNQQESKVKISIHSDPFSGESEGTVTNNVYKGKLTLLVPSLKNLMLSRMREGSKTMMPVRSSLPIMALELKSNIECGREYCNFTGANVSLDDIEGQGDVRIKFGEKIPFIDIKLSANELDITPFLPADTPKPSNDVAAPSPELSENSKGLSLKSDLASLRTFNGNAVFTTGKLQAFDIKSGKAILKVKVQNGHLLADMTDAEFYNGKATIIVNMDAVGAGISVDKRVVFSGVQMEPFLKDAKYTDRFSGTGNMDVHVTGNGDRVDDVVATLAGNGQIKVTDGSIKGINIADMVRNIQSAYKSVNTGTQKTDFAELGGTFTISQGIVTNNDMMMKAPLFRVAGAGTVNLPAQTIRYRLTPQIVSTIQGQGGKDKQGLGVPIIIEGPLSSPTYRPDLEGMAKDALQNPEKIKETVGTVKEQLKENKEAIKDLKGLLKGLKKPE